jgi:hypothetical protein
LSLATDAVAMAVPPPEMGNARSAETRELRLAFKRLLPGGSV